MAYFLFKCWHEQLFYLNRKEMKFCQSDIQVEFIPITKENVHFVEKLRGLEFITQFNTQLSYGDYGYYAFVNGQPVGYGWVKHPGSLDYFFEIGDGCRYLCRFFVCENMRGQKIYPALITALIGKEKQSDCFYIAAERGNEASVNGLRKIGFCFINEFRFIRGFRKTFNMKKLNQL